MKSFDLNAALNGATVQTKDGRAVSNIRVIDNNAPHSAQEASKLELSDPSANPYKQGLLVTLHNPEFTDDYPYYLDGGSHLYGLSTDADLVIVG